MTNGDPEHPLEKDEIEHYIHQLDESTVLTARILLGIWNIRRSEQQLAKDGSAAIRIDDILEWRGVQKHQRLLYEGAPSYTTDGYQWKHKQEVHKDIKLLELFHLRGQHAITIKGKSWQFVIDGPYLRVTSVKEKMGPVEEDPIGYFIAPGAWINTYEEHGNVVLVEIDRRIFQLNPQNDQLALRIALYLTEHWRLHFTTGHYADPMVMQELLKASMIPIDRSNLTSRFIPRVEAALQKLCTQGIIGSADQLTPVDRTQSRWGKEWLSSHWRIMPPLFCCRGCSTASTERFHCHSQKTYTICSYLQPRSINTPPLKISRYPLRSVEFLSSSQKCLSSKKKGSAKGLCKGMCVNPPWQSPNIRLSFVVGM